MGKGATSVAIVGSGIAATAIARKLVQAGMEVTIFEKGPEFPYPHSAQFQERIRYLHWNPAYELAADLRAVTLSGDYPGDVDYERGMVVGGSATHWSAIALRMHPQDFSVRTLFGYGTDWPVGYDDLEAFYCEAENLLGVSGTDRDNPYAPRRSRPYPLPAFALGKADREFAAALARRGIVLHTTPQARTRRAYDGRPACENFGTCNVCPIGARYSPNHHLIPLLATGKCKVVPNTSVRRIVTSRAGRAQSVVYRSNDAGIDAEHAADVVVVAAGALESARLLLLSATDGQRDGLGNDSGHVGRHLVFHHLWVGTLLYDRQVFAGSVGPVTGQTHHFCNGAGRGRHGGIKVEFSSHFPGVFPLAEPVNSGADVLEARRQMPHGRGLILHAESVPDARKFLRLSESRDRFGDPFAHVHYESSDFDRDTYRFGRSVFEQFRDATGARSGTLSPVDHYDSGAHHMGTCRMGSHPADSVVDSFGRVHGMTNLYLAGSSVFAGSSGAVNPTLTIVALALRTAERIAERL